MKKNVVRDSRRGGRKPKPVRARPLAKLSAPRLVDAIARERLFTLLDRELQHPGVWIHGPPGAGKTTLAADYARARHRPLVWYQVDRGDDDVASFFHYFERALEPYRRRRAALPRFVPELLADLAGFTRNFAREAWARLPQGALLVMDNVHEARSDAFARMLAALAQEIPQGISLVAVSRAAPMPALMSQVAQRRIAVLDPDAMQFSVEETSRLLAPRGVPASDVARLQRLTGGWAAGLVLLGEQGTAARRSAQSHEALFSYFATQTVENQPPHWQHFLMVTSVLPKVTAAIGNALAGTTDGALILESLRRQNLFVELRDEETYQYHDLFREFLARNARAKLGPEELARAMRAAAALAERQGWFDEAVPLYLDSEDWDGAARLLATIAPVLLAQGRAQTVEGGIERLPKTWRDERPGLWFALGQARIQRDELVAREAFERAYESYVERGDERGALLAAGAILEALFTSFRDWSNCNHWIATVRRHFSRVKDWPSDLDRLRAHSGQLLALMTSADRDDREAEHVMRVLLPLLANDAIDVNDRLRAASLMVDTAQRALNRGAVFRQVDQVGRLLLEHPASSPLLRARYLLNSADEASYQRDHDGAQWLIDRARAILDEHKWRHMDFALAYRELRVAFHRGDLPACDALIAEIDRQTQPGNAAQETVQALMHYHRDMLKGDRSGAIEHARTGARLGEQVLPTVDYGITLRVLAFALTADGRYKEAAEVLGKAATLGVGFAQHLHRCLQHLTLAAAALPQTPNPHLASGLAIARSMGMRDFLNHLPDLARTLCIEALRQGIEVDFVKEVIADRAFRPVDANDPAWPWPLRVRTLGIFAIFASRGPVAASAKASRRPLDLLKFIVASGRREVSAANAISALWPDLEGDQAKSAFNVALHRLRRMLGIDAAIALEGGQLTLSPEHVWVDAFAFEHYAASAEALFAQGNAVEGEKKAGAALDLYGGHFLGAEDDASWPLVQRSRLSAKYTHLAAMLGRHYVRLGEPQRARQLYERALELEPLAEEVYRELMSTLMALGLPADALRVYRRCREVLSVVLGVKPSAETERVHQTLLAR